MSDLRADVGTPREALEREMSILRGLATRTPHTTRSSSSSTNRVGGASRNDAVVGSSGVFTSPGPLFRGEEEPAQIRYASGEFPDGRKSFSSRFMSVDDLSLEMEDPIKRRHASGSLSERCDDQN